jgi:hypothetical protein
MAKHWYKVDFHEGSKDRTLCGSSDLDAAQFMEQVASAPFVRLDDLVYRDSQNRMRPWGEWDARVKPTVFISSKFVVAVMEFVGDPTKGPPAAQ